MEINSLDREHGCFASNDHFAKWLGLSERQVQDYIKRLKNMGLISVELNKAKHQRTIRVVGKYAHITAEQLADVQAMREELRAQFKK